MEPKKTCTRCGEEKPLAAFHFSANNKDRRMNYCRVCRNKELKRWRNGIRVTKRNYHPAHYQDITGQTFGLLKVVERVGSTVNHKERRPLWLCQCSCGNTARITSHQLRCCGTKSCGCLRKRKRAALGAEQSQAVLQIKPRRREDSEIASNRLFGAYRLGAKGRDLAFALSQQEFAALIVGDCHYCGTSPKQRWRDKGDRRSFLYNGVDRIDNTIGYITENVVTCCGICNKAKNKLTLRQFSDWATSLKSNLPALLSAK